MLRKPASAIASARRAGTTATLDQLNKYFTITQMPIISGRYWNMVHGAAKEDIEKDLAKGVPADRLICGDVGFGKTEVALRAGFIASNSNGNGKFYIIY